MPQGPYITQEIKDLIAQLHIEHPGDSAPKIRKELLKRMKEKGLDLIFGSEWPGESAVSKLLHDYRVNDQKRLPALKRLDEQWSIGTLVEYDIPSDALPKVVQLQSIRHEKSENYKGLEPLTIRQARWIGRLYTLTTDLEVLYNLCLVYSKTERISEITDTINDTFDIDGWILKDPTAPMVFDVLVSDWNPRDIEDTKIRVSKAEEQLGVNLGTPDLTGLSLITYYSMLYTLIRIPEKWKHDYKSKEQLEELLLNLRERAIELGKDKGI